MEYDVNRIEFVKSLIKKNHTNEQTHFSDLYWLNCSWWYIFKSYFLYSNMLREMFYLLCYIVFTWLQCFCVSLTLMCLYPNTMDFYKWITCKSITEHTCWSVGVQLRIQYRFILATFIHYSRLWLWVDYFKFTCVSSIVNQSSHL